MSTYEYDTPVVLTLSGNEITDAVRTAAVQGDRLVPPSGVGVWESTTNLVTNPGFETNTTGWAAGAGASAIARDTSRAAFGTASLRATTTASTNKALASTSISLPALVHTYSAWLFVPSVWTSGTVGLRVSVPAVVTGNEITDATRAAASGLGTGASGQMIDGRTNDSSFGIHRAATNLFRRGQCDSTTDWNVVGGGVVTVATDATVPAPFSTQSIKYTCNGAAANQGGAPRTATGQALVSAPGIGAVYVKGVAGQSYRVIGQWLHTDASIRSGQIDTFTATGAWQLVKVFNPVYVSNGKTGDSFQVRIDINGTRAESFWLAHAMIETGFLANRPYVATSGGATATHAAGQVQASSALLDTTQGWVAMRLRMDLVSGFLNGFVTLFRLGVDSQNYLWLFYDGNSFTLGRSNTAGGPNFAYADMLVFTDDPVTVVAWWDAATLNVSVHDAANLDFPLASGSVAQSDVPSVPDALFAIGPMDSNVLWLASGVGTLAPADITTFNGFGDADPAFAAFPATAKLTTVMPFDTAVYRAESPADMARRDVWQRVSATFTPSATGTVTHDLVSFGTTTSGQQIWLDGAQVEQKPSRTPYTPTARAAARVQGPTTISRIAPLAPSVLINPSQGYFAARVLMGFSPVPVPGATNNRFLFSWSDGTLNNRLQVFFSRSTGSWQTRKQAAGSGASGSYPSAGFTQEGDPVTVVYAWTASTHAVSINGGPYAQIANTSVPAGLLATFDLFNDAGSEAVGFEFDGTALWSIIGTGFPTEAEVSTLNGYGNVLPTDRRVLPASPQIVWLGVDASAIRTDITGAPHNYRQPTLSGSPQVGKVISVNPGVWGGEPPLRYTFDWQRSSDGVFWSSSGLSLSSVLLSSSDLGALIRVRVTATNRRGSTDAYTSGGG